MMTDVQFCSLVFSQVIEDTDNAEEKIKLKQTMEGKTAS